MNSDWLYLNMGTIVKIGGICSLAIIGVLVLHRKSKARKLEKASRQKKPRID